MNILLLRTDTDQTEMYFYRDDRQADQELWESGRQLAETIHIKIQQLLVRQKLDLDDVQGLVIYSGPGSFTGLRIGHSVANALADSLCIPVVGINGRNWISQGIRRLNKGNNDGQALPVYGAPVHVTKPRK